MVIFNTLAGLGNQINQAPVRAMSKRKCMHEIATEHDVSMFQEVRGDLASKSGLKASPRRT